VERRQAQASSFSRISRWISSAWAEAYAHAFTRSEARSVRAELNELAASSSGEASEPRPGALLRRRVNEFGALHRNRGTGRAAMQMSPLNETAPAPAFDLGATARRTWLLFGARSRSGRGARRDDDDDDDLPRPNAIATLFPFLRIPPQPLPA
jgi:hypothetical protein